MSKVNPLQLMLMFCHSGVEVAEMPPLVWKYGVEGLVCPLARLLGYQPFYEVYRTKA